MAIHKWKYNGIYFNFCVKCGLKKSYAGGQPCLINNMEKKSPHIKEYLRKNYVGEKYKCKKCEIHNNRWGGFNVIFSTSETGIAYVPYIVVQKGNRTIYRNADYFKRKFIDSIKKFRYIGRFDVAFWPIYCGLTEDEYMCKDIII